MVFMTKKDSNGIIHSDEVLTVGDMKKMLDSIENDDALIGHFEYNDFRNKTIYCGCINSAEIRKGEKAVFMRFGYVVV